MASGVVGIWVYQLDFKKVTSAQRGYKEVVCYEYFVVTIPV